MAGSKNGERKRLVARRTEMVQLDRVFQDTRAEKGGRGRLVVLTGETGVGKTALAEAFLDRIRSEEQGAVVLLARCVDGRSTLRPYGPFRDMAVQLAALADDPAIGAVLRKTAPAWLPGAAPSAGRNALFDQFIALCRAITQQSPLACLIDDLQWCDRSSLDLLARLGTTLASIPVVFVATYEGSESESAVSIKGLQHRVGANAIELGVRRLEDDAVIKLAEDILGGSFGDELAAWISRTARGLPLRAEQLLLWMSEKKVIKKRLFKRSVRESELPTGDPRIEDVILGRLDEQKPNLRWTLEAAAVGGPVIDSTIVAAQSAKKHEEVLEQLELGTRLGLLHNFGERRWASGPRSVRYRFDHPLVRKAIGDRVSGKRSEHLIGRAAATTEKLAGAAAGELADEIAPLYLEIDDTSKCQEWSLRAADLCERLYALYELESYLRAAARTSSEELARLQIENRLAAVYGATGREPEAEAILEAVYERAVELDDKPLAVRSGTMLGWLRLERGVPPAGISGLVGGMVDAARSAELANELVMALDLSTVVAERIGRAEEALLMAEEALHVAEGTGSPEIVANAAYRLARVHISWDSPQEGRVLAQRALDVYGQVDDLGGAAVCHELLGLANFRAGEWYDALHHWESALESMEVAGVPDQKVAMQANIAELLTLRGEFDRAMRLFKSGLQQATELEDEPLILRSQTGVARLEFERGDYASVLELTEKIRNHLPDSGAWKIDFQTTAIRALAYLELGDELQAWQEAARLEQLYQGKEGWFERRAEGDAVRIRVIYLDGDSWLAGMVAQQGIAETVDKDPYGEGFLRYHQAHILGRDQPGEARKAVERAIELFGKLGAAPMAARARRLSSQLPEADPLEADAGGGGEDDIDDDKIDAWFDSLDG
ncbi:MAG: AAA family ATPase [Gemmatimonadetes bacterium]|uniref:AAA family ATPase n=1 Tax=Candidatus Kutchimonas denitrificans TaxID=3056748 RepID=A0AAE4Z7I6_9BACT|nr:AAA family ATPase [Gemmatimonadota bacterium]NIR73897.1 AAA family ATPase [Candidatus Kutchimonas denitrificans]NIR99703.1 AAA family ATPase [Gemmatimonadota bacterium]NIT65288.1 AAA family ATPase [Gemmatimonadota bacterium]NIW73737.1 AAA family ATPase [Gemmatimonadota bacterium]